MALGARYSRLREDRVDFLSSSRKLISTEITVEGSHWEIFGQAYMSSVEADDDAGFLLALLYLTHLDEDEKGRSRLMGVLVRMLVLREFGVTMV